VATAHLSAGIDGKPRRYSLTLEAKSKREEGKRVATATVNTATIVRHRNAYKCEHALVVGPSFATTQGNKSSIADEIDNDRRLTVKDGQPKTITLIHVDDLARLVQLRPIKRVGLAKIRDMLIKCRLPDECKAWIDAIEKENVPKPPYAKIVNAIHQLQKDYDMAAVEYAALRVSLGKENPPIKYATNEELIELCKAMSQMARDAMSAGDRTVELDQSPKNVLDAIESATKAHLADKK